MRYDILNGDITTAGGQVVATTQNDMIGGRAVVYERDPVWCPQCKTAGWVACVGERPPSRGPHGQEQALSDDWCICKCDPPPRLIASQNKSFTT